MNPNTITPTTAVSSQKRPLSTLLIVLIAVLITALITGGGMYLALSAVYKDSIATSKIPLPSQKVNSTNPVSATITQSNSNNITVTANEKIFSLKCQSYFSFNYPEGFIFTDYTNSQDVDSFYYFILRSQDSIVSVKAFKESFEDHVTRVKNSFQIYTNNDANLENPFLIEGARYFSLENPPYHAKVVVFDAGNYSIELEQKNVDGTKDEIQNTQEFDQMVESFTFQQDNTIVCPLPIDN